MKKTFLNWILVVFWLALIFFLSSQPNLKTNLGYDWWLRKAAHMVEFGILCFLLFRALVVSHEFSIKSALIISIIFSMLYAASDEYHQTFILGRSGNIQDWGIDGAGIILAGILIGFLNDVNQVR